MPATCVPWPTSSPERVALELTHVDGDARAAVGALEVRLVAADPGVDDGDADALAGDAGGPELVRADGLRVGRRQHSAGAAVLRIRVLSVTLPDPLAAAQRHRVARPELDGETVDGREPAHHLAVTGTDERTRRALRGAGLNCTITSTLRFGCAFASLRQRGRRRVGDRALAPRTADAASRNATVRAPPALHRPEHCVVSRPYIGEAKVANATWRRLIGSRADYLRPHGGQGSGSGHSSSERADEAVRRGGACRVDYNRRPGIAGALRTGRSSGSPTRGGGGGEGG